MFLPKDLYSLNMQNAFFCTFQILHSHISSVTKLPTTTTGSPIQLRTKTFQSITFIIPKNLDAQNLFTSLTQMSQPG